MDIIPSLIRDYGWAIYIAAALGCVYFIIVGLTSMRDLNKAVFGLERSSVSARAGSAWVRAALCIVIGIGVYIASNMMGAAPTRVRITSIINATATVPAGVVLVPTSGPTADFLAPVITPTFVIQSARPQAAAAEATAVPETPAPNLLTEVSAVIPGSSATAAVIATSTPVPGLPTAAPLVTASNTPNAATSIAGTASSRSTPTTPTPRALSGTPSATSIPVTPFPTLPPTDTPIPESPTPALAAVPAADCADPLTVGISTPQNGQTVSGQLAILGNAGIDPAGGYAKLEVLLPAGWGFINKIDNPVKDGILGSLNTSALGQGVHRIRLMRVDKNQREDLLCAISILVAS